MRVVFLCTGNSARSQMAEGFAKAIAGDRFDFVSAGATPSERVNPHAIQAMREVGIDLGTAFPKSFDSLSLPIDLVVAVCGQAAESCPIPTGEGRLERWDLPDPATAVGSPDELSAVFRASRDEIEQRVRDLIERLG